MCIINIAKLYSCKTNSESELVRVSHRVGPFQQNGYWMYDHKRVSICVHTNNRIYYKKNLPKLHVLLSVLS